MSRAVIAVVITTGNSGRKTAREVTAIAAFGIDNPSDSSGLPLMISGGVGRIEV